MKPTDMMSDHADYAEKNGTKIRKGTAAAFIANAKLLATGNLSKQMEAGIIEKMTEIIPQLQAFGFFDVLKIRSDKVRKIIQQKFPMLDC